MVSSQVLESVLAQRLLPWQFLDLFWWRQMPAAKNDADHSDKWAKTVKLRVIKPKQLPERC